MVTLFVATFGLLVGLFALKLVELKRGERLFLNDFRDRADYKLLGIHHYIRRQLRQSLRYLRHQYQLKHRSLRRSLSNFFAAVARKLGE